MTHLLPHSSGAALRRPSSSQILHRLLETPDLAAQIAALPPASLGRLIDRVGLADAGEIVALATTEQLVHVFDEDLWTSSRVGEDERFDADRFVLWLEILLEAGERFVAARLLELPEDLVTLAFHREILVLRLDEMIAEMAGADEDEAHDIEKALADCLYEELDEYQLVARHHEGWDAVLTSLLALDREDHAFVARLLERCARMSSDQIEESGGLSELLSASESLEDDVAGAREDRRARAGYVAPSAAAAFLEHARTVLDPLASGRDPLTRAWFRDLAASPAASPAVAAAPEPVRLGRAVAEAIASEEPEVAPARRLPAGEATEREPEDLLAIAMRDLATTNAQAFAERSDELAYVANVLVAGTALLDGDGNAPRRLRPIEATRAAIAVVSRGLAERFGDRAIEPRLLETTPIDALFAIGWKSLHGDKREVRHPRPGAKNASARATARRSPSVGETLAARLVTSDRRRT